MIISAASNRFSCYVAALFAAVALLARPCDALTVSGKFQYYDRADVLRPLKFVKVELKNGATDAVLGTTYTSSSGLYSFAGVTNPGSQGFRAEASTFWLASTGEGFAIRQKDPGEDQFTPSSASAVYTTSQTSFTIPDVTVLDPGPFQMHRELVDAFLWTAQFGDGDKRGPGCEVVWYTEVPEYHPTRFISGSSSPGEARIEVYGRDAESPEFMLIAYGMAVMWHACGQWLPTSTPHEWTATMPLEYETTEADAWKKGFAAWFYMALVEQTEFHDWHRGIWYHLEPPTWGDAFYSAGQSVECMVAAALWDLGDSYSPSDGIDTANFDWFELWDVWYGQRFTSFSQFWDRWKALGKPRHDALKALYQSTIDLNTAPTMNPIGDVWILEDSVVNSAVDLWPLTSDADSSDAELSFSIQSVQRPQCGAFIYNGRYVGFDPDDNWNGTSTVTVKAFDGIRATTREFTVTVQPVNDTPNWTTIPTVTQPEDQDPYQARDLHAYASDAEDADSELDFEIVTSTNPQAGVYITGNRYLAVAPAANWNGTSTVTVKVTDTQGASRTTSFDVTITPVNDPPQWAPALPDQTLLEDTPRDNAINLWSYAADVEQPDAELAFAIIENTQPDAGVTLDSNRYIDINPAAGWTGMSTVTVRVTDGEGASATDTFLVSVQSVNDPPVLSGVPDVFCQKNGNRDNVLDLWAYTTHQDVADPVTYSIESTIPPGPGITLDSNRYIDVAPASGWTGVTIVVIRVTDSLGAYSEDTVEFRVGTVAGSPAEARNIPDGEWVQLGTFPVSAHFPGAFYMGSPHASGIRVAASPLPPVGSMVAVFGLMGSWEAERIIQSYLITTLAGYTVDPAPSTMRVGWVGGSAGRGLAPPLDRAGAGIYNVGQIVRAIGKVAAWDALATRYTIEDGSLPPGQAEPAPPMLIDDPESGWRPAPGTWVELTGISGATFAEPGTASRVLRLRGHTDVRVLRFTAALVHGPDSNTAKSFGSLLRPEGIAVTTLSVNSAATHDFSNYALVILAADSGTWTNSAAVNKVLAGGRPIFGIGEGGARFFDQVTSPDLYIGFENSATSSISSGKLGSSSITEYPYKLPYAVGDTVGIMNTPAMAYSVSDRAFNCVHLISHPTLGFSFPVAREGDFWQWGYNTAPSMLTTNGWKLFVDTLYEAATY